MGKLAENGVPQRLEGFQASEVVKRNLSGKLGFSKEFLCNVVREYEDEVCLEVLKRVGVDSLSSVKDLEGKFSTAIALEPKLDELVGFGLVLDRLVGELGKTQEEVEVEWDVATLDYLYDYYLECLRLRLAYFNKMVLETIYLEKIPEIVNRRGSNGGMLPDFDEEIWIKPDMSISEYNETRREYEDEIDDMQVIDNDWYEEPYYSDYDINRMNEYEDFLASTRVISDEYEEYEEVCPGDLLGVLLATYQEDLKKEDELVKGGITYSELLDNEYADKLIPIKSLIETNFVYESGEIEVDIEKNGMVIHYIDYGSEERLTPLDLYCLWLYRLPF